MTISLGLTLLEKANRLIGHNIQDYDLPALKKLYGFEFTVKSTTPSSCHGWFGLTSKTMTSSLLPNPKARIFPQPDWLAQSKAWGHRLGNNKGDFEYTAERFAQWSKEMQEYLNKTQLNRTCTIDYVQVPSLTALH